ncbi:MAG: ABC transporter permease [Candidatus Omnitrophica bacterium]|nr:ABC transporter permease [Candidatus Omnitrophota bacterium]MCM8799048.1 ABC transporter permease [Candidatus Omnitrophota bacterium]
MKAYIVRRLLISLPLLLAISFITFLFLQLAPGDYFDTLRLNPQISPETIRLYEAQYHLDKPWIIQYLYWLKNLLKLDLGYSFTQKNPVSRVIKSRLFNTLLLSLSSLLFTWLIAIPLGIFCAVRQYRFWDKLFSGLSFIGLSTPSFFLAILLLFLASVTGVLPSGGMRSADFEELGLFMRVMDILKHLLIPTVVVSLGAIASLQRIMRGNVLEVLRQRYILTARAKGLSEKRILYIHALKNAINPLITIFGYHLSDILSGAALTEIICNWPGLGSIMLTAVRSQDIFLVMGAMLMGGVMLILGNLVADILLARLDPRIRYE